MAIEKKIYAYPNRATPSRPVVYNPELCNGCNQCVEICTTDVIVPNPEKGKPPIVLYPEECWYGGCCVEECPIEGAIMLNHPMMSKVRFKRKETGEYFRVR